MCDMLIAQRSERTLKMCRVEALPISPEQSQLCFYVYTPTLNLCLFNLANLLLMVLVTWLSRYSRGNCSVCDDQVYDSGTIKFWNQVRYANRLFIRIPCKLDYIEHA